MSDINGFFFIGNLGADPELQYTDGGTAVCRFSIANTRHRVDKEGQRTEKTSWFNITAWGRQAENVAKYLEKGSKIGVKGWVEQNIWEDKTGKRNYSINFISENIQFISKPRENRQSDKQSQKNSRQDSKIKVTRQSYGENTGTDVDQIPF